MLFRSEGTLTDVAGMAVEVKDRDGNATGLRVFEAKVSLAKQDERLRPGMTARVELVVESRSGVLVVPTGAPPMRPMLRPTADCRKIAAFRGEPIRAESRRKPRPFEPDPDHAGGGISGSSTSGPAANLSRS